MKRKIAFMPLSAKSYHFYLKHIIVISCLIAPFIGTAQKNTWSIGLQVPLQCDFEKEVVPYPFFSYPQEQKKTVLNYGANILIEKKLGNRFEIFTGLAYLSKKFGLKRPYDHEQLNQGHDSLPIGTLAVNYIYKFARLPLGISYTIKRQGKIAYNVGGDFYINYIFKKIYNGGVPYPGANNKLSKFQYSGNSADVFLNASIQINRTSFLEIEPYVQVFDIYKQDAVLYEDPGESITRHFDAVGLRLKYSLSLKK
jgi:hypothetical protein